MTNLHVMTGSVLTNPSGDEEMYQESVSADKKVGSLHTRGPDIPVADPYCPAWDADRPAWVCIKDGPYNVADVAICGLDEGVDADFILHEHPNHSRRQVIAGVVEPVKDDENPMELTMLGAFGGAPILVRMGRHKRTGVLISSMTLRDRADRQEG